MTELLDDMSAYEAHKEVIDTAVATPDEFFARMDSTITKEREAKDAVESQGMKAFGLGALDAGTVGFADRFKSDETIAGHKEITDANPIASFMGNVAGAASATVPLSKLVTSVAKGAGALSNIARAANKSTATRVVAAGITGGLEGGTHSWNKGNSVLEGVASGAIGGTAGQAVLGEMLPALFKSLKGLKDGKATPDNHDYVRARKMLKERIEYSNPNMEERAIDDLITKLESLGPDAMLADVDDALYAMGIDLIAGRPNPRAATALASNIKKRYEAAPEQMKLAITDAIGKDTVYSPSMSKSHAKQAMKTYSPAYGKALAESDMAVPYQDVAETVFDSFGIKTPEGSRIITTSANAANNKMQSMMRRMASSGGKPIPKNAKMNDAGEFIIKGKNGKPDKVLNVDPISATGIDGMIKELDKMYKNVLDPFSAESVDIGLAGDIGALRASFKEALNEGSGLSAISKLYKDEHLYNTGYEMGQKAITAKKVDEDALNIWMENADALEISAMLNGAKYELAQVIAEDGMAGFTKQLSKSSKLRAKLNSVFGKDVTDTLVNSADNIAKFGANDAKAMPHILRTTGGNAQASSLTRDATVAALGLGTDRVSNTAATSATMNLRSKIDPRVGPTNEALSNLLATQGPEAIGLLKSLRNPAAAANSADPSMFTGGLLEMVQPDDRER